MLQNLIGNFGMIVLDVNWDPFILAIGSIIVGIMGIYGGIKIKKFYATIGMSGYVTKKEIEPSGGRILFVVVGLVFLSAGIYLLVNLFLN